MPQELILRDTGTTRWGRAVFELAQPYFYRLRMDTPERGIVSLVVRVPQGYQTDYASIPRPLWSILSPTGPWRRAALLHDFLCDIRCPRFLTDAIFRHVMEQDGVGLCARCAIYYAVRTYWTLIGRWRVIR